MIDSELQLYYDQIFQFCKSVVIKSDLMALQKKDATLKNYGVEILDDKDNPYYQHLCGQYSADDDPVYIIEDGNKVILDQALMIAKPWIRKKYNIYDTPFTKLISEYPGRENFIRFLIMRPCETMDELLNKDDFHLLAYDASILETQERYPLLEDLRKYVNIFKERWHIKEFAYEELYGMDLVSKFYMLLPSYLLGRRINNLKTQYAHSFHIWNHLSSYGLDDYRSVLSIDQQLFLYKNIDYIVKNIGKHGTLAILIDKLLSQNYLSIEPQMIVNDYPVEPIGEMINVTPYIVARKFDETPITKFFGNKASSLEQFYEMLNRDGFITENDYKDHATITRKLGLMNHTTLQTKFLELKRSIPQRPYLQFLFSMLIGGVIHYLGNGKLKFSIEVIEEKLDFAEVLDTKVAFMLLMYLLLKEDGVETPMVPTKMKAYPFIRNYDTLLDTNIRTNKGIKKLSDYINIVEFKARFRELDSYPEFNFSEDSTSLMLSFSSLIVQDLFFCYENEYGLNEALNQLHNQMYIVGNNEVDIYGSQTISMKDWFRANSYVVYDLLNDIESDTNIETNVIVDQILEGFLPSRVLNDPKYNLNLSNDEKYTKLKQLFIQLCSYNVVFIDPNLKNQSSYLHDPLTVMTSDLTEMIGLSDIELLSYTPIPYSHPDLQIGEEDPLRTGKLRFKITVNDPLDFLIEYMLELSRNSNFSTVDKVIKGTENLSYCEIGIKPNEILTGTEYFARVSYRSRLFDWKYEGPSNVLNFNSGKIVNPTLFFPVLSDAAPEEEIVKPTIRLLDSSTSPEFSISAFKTDATGTPKGTLILTAEEMDLTFNHEDLHVASRWFVASDPEMETITHDSGWREDKLLEYRIPWDKAINSNVYFAVMFKGLRFGESGLSNIASFEMRNIKKPVILNVAGQFNPLADSMLTITADAFACLGDYQDIHKSSNWLASIDEAMTKIIYNSGWDVEDLIEEATPPFRDTYSAAFKILTPSIEKVQTGDGYVFTITKMDSTPMVNSETPESLYLTVQYRGEVLGLSDRSDPYRIFSSLEPRGHLVTNILPEGAISAGARWRRKGTVPWRVSGYKEEFLLVGSYIIEFNKIAGWVTPNDMVISITDGAISTITGEYTEAPLLGGIRVTILPEDAAARSGWWRILDINGVWCQSGITVNDLVAGTYQIEFTEVEDYMVKEPIEVIVANGIVTDVTAEYARRGAKITATLAPPDVIAAGGKWRLVGSTEWLDSGAQLTGVQTGTYSFEFQTIENFFVPTPEPISVINGDNVELVFSYGIIGVPVPVMEEMTLGLGMVVGGRKRTPPVDVTVTIINGEEYIDPLSSTVPYRTTTSFNVTGGVVISANDESIIVGGTAP